MSEALEGRVQPEFAAPPGIVEVKIDPETGKPAGDGERGVVEPFKQGTEPVAQGDEGQKVQVQDLFTQ
jgi:penicillin-binding protein 1A